MTNTYSLQLPAIPGTEWRVRVIPANFDLSAFPWERMGLWMLPPVLKVGNYVSFSETQFAILERREELRKPARVFKSNYTLAWKDRAVLPNKHIKEKIGAFLHAKGLPTVSLKGNGQLVACLRIIHATNLGFDLEGYYEVNY